MRSKLLNVLVFYVISVAACNEVFANDCMLLSAHNRYQNADAVFVGTAVSKTDSEGHILFHVDKGFWGTTGDSIIVKHYDPVISDSFAFRVGKKYLVVAYKEKGELTVGPCNQGAGIKLATADLHVLRSQLKGESLPYVYGVVTRKDEEPLSNARVTLRSQQHPSRVVAETRTGSDGYFEFRSVSPGGYFVIATPPEGGTPMKDSFATGFPGVRLIMHDW
jgi:hypothetical protein